jgi:hypothetical protein
MVTYEPSHESDLVSLRRLRKLRTPSKIATRPKIQSTIDDTNRNKDLLESRHVETLEHLAK